MRSLCSICSIACASNGEQGFGVSVVVRAGSGRAREIVLGESSARSGSKNR